MQKKVEKYILASLDAKISPAVEFKLLSEFCKISKKWRNQKWIPRIIGNHKSIHIFSKCSMTSDLQG